MDDISKKVLELSGIHFDKIEDIEGQIIPRDSLLSDNKYEEIKKLIPELKTKYSSSVMTSLQKNAKTVQKFPLLNIVRQILNNHNYKMLPIRKSDGYTLDGVKKYKRFFQLERKKVDSIIDTNTTTDKDIDNNDSEPLSEDILV